MRTNLWVFLAAALVPAAAVADDDATTNNHTGPRARATFVGCDPAAPVTGRAILQERASTEGVKLVDIALFASGLPAGKHAVHIHATGNCTPCAAAGGHFDPGPAGNTSPDGNHPFHSGDLINLVVGSRGSGSLSTTTSRVTISAGPLSLFDADGSAFIIHVAPDTYCPDGEVAGCAGGARAACGIIRLDN
jgi:Cu-Zn family superoxide dismutase